MGGRETEREEKLRPEKKGRGQRERQMTTAKGGEERKAGRGENLGGSGWRDRVLRKVRGEESEREEGEGRNAQFASFQFQGGRRQGDIDGE